MEKVVVVQFFIQFSCTLYSVGYNNTYTSIYVPYIVFLNLSHILDYHYFICYLVSPCECGSVLPLEDSIVLPGVSTPNSTPPQPPHHSRIPKPLPQSFLISMTKILMFFSFHPSPFSPYSPNFSFVFIFSIFRRSPTLPKPSPIVLNSH
jgi:hypothetical protein